MAQLFPTNFEISSLEHSEAVVVKSFLDNLEESWVVIPSVNITHKGQDREIDVILICQDHGAYVVEVKGGKITIDQGQWKSYDHKIKNPALQALTAKYQLISRLTAMKVDISQIHIQHIVAFPDIITFPEEGAGPDCPRESVFTKAELAKPFTQLGKLRADQPLFSEEALKKFLRAIRPDVREIDVQGGSISGVSERIARSTIDQLSIVFGLDENRRAHIRGAAGTGKTFIATNWAKRAVERGERTLVICYNRELGIEINNNMAEFTQSLEDPSLLTVSSFHAFANVLLGDKAPKNADNQSSEWWRNHHAELILANLDSINQRFDTIIVDEGQDFYPLWFAVLDNLLVDKTTSRLLVMSDEAQAIYAEAPELQPNVATLRLDKNVRNTNKIAALVRRLGGAEVTTGITPGQDIDIYPIGGLKERRKAFVKALTKVRDELAIPPSQTLILVRHNRYINELMDDSTVDFPLCKWADRDEEHYPFGTIHGTKGLERMAVILIDDDEEPDLTLTYIGASRAVMYLAVIGQKALTDQLT
jgi:hypothetical protein